MALSILDGNQSATTLSTILSSGQHITAHTVVSLGTQAITDIVNATSAGLTNAQLRASAVTIGGTVTANLDPNSSVISSQIEAGIGSYAADLANDPFPISGTVTIGSALPAGTNRIGVVTIGGGTVTIGAGTAQIGSVTVGNSVTIGSLPAISGTVTANILSLPDNATGFFGDGHNNLYSLFESGSLAVSPISGTVTIGSALPAGTNRIGVVTIGAGTVTIGAGTAQIGSVTVGNSVTISSLPAISGTVTANFGNPSSIIGGGYNDLFSLGDDGQLYATVRNFPATQAISGTVTANTFAVQGTAVTTSNFTSTTASTVLANYNATREVLTIFNEGAGNLHICAGATCTTIAYQVRLSAGDYYEVPNHQTTITHSAVFATAGTARVTQVS